MTRHMQTCGMKVRYLIATDLIETLYRGLENDTVGNVIKRSAPQRIDFDRKQESSNGHAPTFLSAAR